MQRGWKWLRRGLAALALLALAATLFYILVLPGMVERRLLAALREAGMADARLRLRSVSPGSMTLADVSLSDRLGATGARADYTLALLRAGRVGTVELVGAEWEVRVRGGRIDWGLPALRAAPGRDPEAPFDLPFAELVLRSSTLVVDLDGRRVRVPIEGTLKRGDGGELRLALAMAGAALPEALIEGLRIEARGRLGGGRLENLRARATAERLDVVGVGGRELALEISQAGERLAYVLNAHVHPDVQARVAGEMAGVPAVAAEAGALVASAAWSATGPLPPPAARWLAQRGVGATGLGPLHLAGHAEATWQPASASDAGGSRWTVALHDVRLDAAGQAADAALTLPGAILAGPALALRARGQADASGFRLTVLPDSTLTAASARGRGWSAQEITADILGDLAWAPQAPLSYDATVALAAHGAVLDAADLALRDIAARVPVVSREQDVPAGEFRAAAHWGPRELPPLAGAVAIAGRRATLTATWPLFDEAPLEARAWLDWSSPRPAGEVTAQIAAFTLSDAQRVAALLPPLAGLRVTGRFAFSAEAALGDESFKPRLRLTAADARVESANLDASAEGIAGELVIDRLVPLGSPGGQSFKVARARSGEMDLRDGEIAFRIEDRQTFFVERCAFRLGSGTFRAHAFRFDTRQDRLVTEVFLEHVDLRDWLAELTRGKVAGEGQVYGRLPIALQLGPRKAVAIGGGFLYAQPGTGVLQVRDTQELEQVLAQSGLPGRAANVPPAPRPGGDPAPAQDVQEQIKRQLDIQRRLVEALSDFEYSFLRVFFERHGGQTEPRIEVRGQGRRGDRQPVSLNLHLPGNGFDIMLNSALFKRSGLDDAGRDLDEALDDRSPANGGRQEMQP